MDFRSGDTTNSHGAIVANDNLVSADSILIPAVVTARGTEDGLVLRIDGKAEWSTVLSEIDSFLGGKKRFFQGGEVSIEWLERLPTKEQSIELEEYLKANFSMTVQQRKRRLGKLIKSAVESKLQKSLNIEDADQNNTISNLENVEATVGVNLGSDERFSTGVESLLQRVEKLAQAESYEGLAREGALSFVAEREISLSGAGYVEKVARFLGEDLLFDEEANSRIVFGTLRSGQRVETPFSLIVVGDVNPGADLVAGGDILVIGSLRGTAHAGAYEDNNYDRVIFALHMQPMQLRISSVVSRGSGDSGKVPEVARIDNRAIVVEPYLAKTLSKRNKASF